jgi:hypothetical protein
MSDSVRVQLATDPDRLELTAYLVDRGFSVRPVRANGVSTLDITHPATAGVPLDDELWDAVTSWLDASRRPLVPTVVHDHEYALAPPGE